MSTYLHAVKKNVVLLKTKKNVVSYRAKKLLQNANISGFLS